MNKERRKRIEEASAKIAEAEAALQAAQEIIQEVRDGEESARENLPESLQDGERGQFSKGSGGSSCGSRQLGTITISACSASRRV